MVHQLSLVSTIPYNSYIQTVSTLQALTGLTSPQPISTYSMLCKPTNVFKPKFEPGKVNQIEQYFMKSITTWDDDSIHVNEPIMQTKFTDKLFTGKEEMQKNWTLQISDIPIAGKNQVCSAQTIYELTLVHNYSLMERINHDGKLQQQKVTTQPSQSAIPPDSSKGEFDDLIVVDNDVNDGDNTNNEKTKSNESVNKDSFLQFLNDLGYDVVNQYWIKGVRFFHGDIVIEIIKIFIRDDNYKVNKDDKLATPNLYDATNDKIPLKLLDESNGFQIKAFINVPKSTDIDEINKGHKDLLKLQDFLKNLVKFEIPDRIFMDSRVSK